jgi:exopolysaccharide/PEP-CTERM locus tyrosine autokinase
MGKVADALEKAGFGEENSAERQRTEPAPTVEIVIPKKKVKPITKPSKPHITRPTGSSVKWDERLLKVVNDDGYLSEVFRTLRSRILHPQHGRAVPKTIMVTSAKPSEGKSFITTNLGISLAQGVDQYSLLVDCDFRRPALAAMLGMDNSKGLVDYLRDRVDLSDLFQKTSVNKLSILPSGRPPVNPSELLGSTRMAGLFEELSSRYDDRFVIFDSPPMQVASETNVLAGQVDAVIVVVRQGKAGKDQIQKLIELIGAERILGIVFNDHRTNIIENTLMKDYGYYQSYE